MSQHDLVSIIVPAFNEAPSLVELYERTRKVLAGLRPFEFIVIDDGSTDGTLETLRALRTKYPNLCILSHFRNHGKSLTLMQGFAAARGEVAIIMDADLQDDPREIPKFLEVIKKDKEVREFINEMQRRGISEVKINKEKLTREQIIKEYKDVKHITDDYSLDDDENYLVDKILEYYEKGKNHERPHNLGISSHGDSSFRLRTQLSFQWRNP